jgi:hypothetical protein
MSMESDRMTAQRWMLAAGIGLGWAILIFVTARVAAYTLCPNQTVRIILTVLVGVATITVIYSGRWLVRRVVNTET